MKILVLNWRDPKHPLAGGAEISLYEHIKYWRKKDAKVTWFASSFVGASEEENLNGIKIVRRGSHYTVVLNFFIDSLKGKYRDYDVYVDCFHFIPYLTPLYIKNKKIVALINEVAGKIWFQNLPYPLAFIGYKIEPFIIHLYNKIPFITGSESTMKELLEVGIKKRNVNVVHHGIHPLKVDNKIKKEKEPTLIFLGRISKDKGIEDALRMMEILIKENPKIALWVVGKYESETYKEKIKNLVDDLKIKKNVKFFGFVDEMQKSILLKKAWILVHPSKKEGWGLNVIEANSVNTPTVGYNVSGLNNSIIDKKTGLLINPDILSLKDSIIELINNKSKLNKLSVFAKKWSKKFSWETSGIESWRIINKEYGK